MTDAISRYLRDLLEEGAAQRVDATRLMEEAQDHLLEAASRYSAAGVSSEDAANRAIESFGRPAWIISQLADLKGEVMKLRYAAAGLAAISLATLLVGHITPSYDVAGSLHEVVLLGAFGGMAIAATLLAFASSWTAALLVSLLGVASFLAVATSAAGEFGLYVVSGGHLATLATVLVIVAVVGHYLRARGSAGIALAAAGVTNLFLNGAFERIGGLGDGQANLGVALITTGWILILLANLAPGVSRRIRSFSAKVLLNVSRKLDPVPTQS